MPEGDTVKRTAQGLHAALAGRPLLATELRWGALGGLDLSGREVIGATAYGKNILLRLAAADTTSTRMPTTPTVPLTLHSHLRMDGSWRIARTHRVPKGRLADWNDPQIRAVLVGTEWTCTGVLLGMLNVLPSTGEHSVIGHLGPDILADDWDTSWAGAGREFAPNRTLVDAQPRSGRDEGLSRWAEHADRPVGEVLLEQRVVAGIGTFYMAETLFAQRVSPWAPAGDTDAGALLDTARLLLVDGVTRPTPNTTGDPRPRETAFVHTRSGLPCRRCGTLVRVAGVREAPQTRPAFYCPTCQPGPTPTDDGRVARPLGAVPANPGIRNVGLGPARWRQDR